MAGLMWLTVEVGSRAEGEETGQFGPAIVRWWLGLGLVGKEWEVKITQRKSRGERSWFELP